MCSTFTGTLNQLHFILFIHLSSHFIFQFLHVVLMEYACLLACTVLIQVVWPFNHRHKKRENSRHVFLITDAAVLFRFILLADVLWSRLNHSCNYFILHPSLSKFHQLPTLPDKHLNVHTTWIPWSRPSQSDPSQWRHSRVIVCFPWLKVTREQSLPYAVVGMSIFAQRRPYITCVWRYSWVTKVIWCIYLLIKVDP